MDHRVRQIQKERLVFILGDESHRFLGVSLGERFLISGILDYFLATHQRYIVAFFVTRFDRFDCQATKNGNVIGNLVCRIDPHVVGVRNAVIGIKSLVGRQAGREVTEMPFADTSGLVTGIAQHIGDRHFVGMKARIAVGKQHGIHAEPLVVAACHQRSSRTGTDRTADVKIVKPHAFGGHPIQVGSLRSGRSIKPNIAVAHVVDKYDDHIRPLGSAEGSRQKHRQESDRAKGNRFHGV